MSGLFVHTAFFYVLRPLPMKTFTASCTLLCCVTSTPTLVRAAVNPRRSPALTRKLDLGTGTPTPKLDTALTAFAEVDSVATYHRRDGIGLPTSGLLQDFWTQKTRVVEADKPKAANTSVQLVLDQFTEEDEDCSGQTLHSYVFNLTGPPNFAEEDTCIQVKNQSGTKMGHVRFFCSGTEMHLDEFLNDPDDKDCDKNEPRSLVIRGDQTSKVSSGDCVVSFDQNETKVHVKFRDIDEGITWPNCENSGGGLNVVLIIVLVGVGLLILLGVAAFILWRNMEGGEPKQPWRQPHGGEGEAESWGES